MKKLICFCMTFVITLSMIGSVTLSYAEVQIESTVKVGLFFGSTAKKSVSLKSDRGFYAGAFNDRVFVEHEIIENTEVSIGIGSNGQITVSDANGTLIYQETGNNGIGLCPVYTDFWDEKLYIDDNQFRGSLNLIKDGGAFAVINIVDMDQYLYGVVSREMSASWPIESLKAQSVCSRNFAAQSLGRHEGYGFDICANTHCQMYTGIAREAESIYEAVDSTRGLVMSYNDELCRCYYAAAMGPVTENVKYVWGNELPYLVSVDNSYEDTPNIPNGEWSGVITVTEASTIMRNKGYDVGDVEKIEVLEYSPNGRVTKMRVTGNYAVKTLELEACRTLFSNITKSQTFSVVGDGDSKGHAYVMVTDGISVVKIRPSQLELLTSTGRSDLGAETLYTTNGQYQKTYSDTADDSKPNTQFTFKGVGWGHGVGMSQYGARGMAENGYTYDEILTHYFSGAQLTRAY